MALIAVGAPSVEGCVDREQMVHRSSESEGLKKILKSFMRYEGTAAGGKKREWGRS